MSIGKGVSGNAARFFLETGHDDDPAIIDGSRLHTYRDLRAASARFVDQLQRHDLPPGARIGILGSNSLHWAAGYLAGMHLGMVAVPLPTAWSAEETDYAARWVDCRLLIAEPAALRHVPPGWTDRVLTVDLDGEAVPDLPLIPAVDPDSDAALMFTSGTTARPHAVRVTHRNLIANTESILGYLPLARDDRMLVILPFSYCYGASLLHTHLRAGGAVVLCNSFAFPEVAVKAMEEHCCTGFAGVPSSYQLLLQASTFAHRDLPYLRRMLQAGGKMHDGTIEEVIRSQPEAQLFVMYGQTEATARLSYLPPEFLSSKLGSIGRGIPGVELQVVDADGHPTAPGEVGEIHATGDNISPGYLDDPAATSARFDGQTLHTGDMARVDEDGFIFVVGRASDFIKTWGYRISALEVEAALVKSPGVVAAAVFGVPDEAAGEAIVAAVLLDNESTASADGVLDHCRRTLPRHMTPRAVHILQGFPLNPAGKVDKAALAEQLGFAVSAYPAATP
jgi:acyl-CoA synthetase (AMP-forming)/AMP-acid ligase II